MAPNVGVAEVKEKKNREIQELVKCLARTVNLACKANVCRMDYRLFDLEYLPIEKVIKKYVARGYDL